MVCNAGFQPTDEKIYLRRSGKEFYILLCGWFRLTSVFSSSLILQTALLQASADFLHRFILPLRDSYWIGTEMELEA